MLHNDAKNMLSVSDAFFLPHVDTNFFIPRQKYKALQSKINPLIHCIFSGRRSQRKKNALLSSATPAATPTLACLHTSRIPIDMQKQPTTSRRSKHPHWVTVSPTNCTENSHNPAVQRQNRNLADGHVVSLDYRNLQKEVSTSAGFRLNMSRSPQRSPCPCCTGSCPSGLWLTLQEHHPGNPTTFCFFLSFRFS